MSAEVLREAARLMRERAEGATPGPWQCFGDHLVWPSEKGPAANDPIAGFGPDHQDTAPHIASWPPEVALAAADWLEATAKEFDSFGMTHRLPSTPLDGRRTAGLAFARVYLGESA